MALTDARARVIGLGRRSLTKAASRSRLARLTFARISAELQHALPDDTYGGAYFGEGRSPLGRMGLSGYNRYDRYMSNADVVGLPRLAVPSRLGTRSTPGARSGSSSRRCASSMSMPRVST